MKCNVLLVISFLLFASCSHKQFSFRKAIKVSNQKQEELAKIELDMVTENHQNDEVELVPVALTTNKFIPTQTDVLALPIVSSSEGVNSSTHTVFGYSGSNINQLQKIVAAQNQKIATQPYSKNDEPKGRLTSAILGFAFSLIGFGFLLTLSVLALISIPLLIVGLILSIRGLKSNVYGLALAIAGIIISSLGLLFWLVAVLIMILILAYYK